MYNLCCINIGEIISIIASALAIIAAIFSIIAGCKAKKYENLSNEAKESIIKIEKDTKKYHDETKNYHDKIEPYYEKGADWFEYQSENVNKKREFEKECNKVLKFIQEQQKANITQLDFVEIWQSIYNSDITKKPLLINILQELKKNNEIKLLPTDTLDKSQNYIIVF